MPGGFRRTTPDHSGMQKTFEEIFQRLGDLEKPGGSARASLSQLISTSPDFPVPPRPGYQFTTTGSSNADSAISIAGTAENTSAAAIGDGSYAGGTNAIAFGNSASAKANGTCALGPYSQAIGLYSLASGYSAYAESNEAIAVGYRARTNFRGGISMGGSSLAFGTGSISIGGSAQSVGASSVAIGFSTESGRESVAIGYDAAVHGAGAVGLGAEAKTTASHSADILANGQNFGRAPVSTREHARINARTLEVRRAANLDPLGEYPADQSTELILHSPSGAAWSLTVDDSGVLSVSPASTPTYPNWSRVRPASSSWRGSAIACSGSGSVAIAAGGWPDNALYVTTDSGATWVKRGPSASWSFVSISADGSKMIAQTDSYAAYRSTDSGATWTAFTIPTGYGRRIIDASNDLGVLIVAAGGGVYKSTDLGATWTEILRPDRVIISTTISGNGQTIYVSIANDFSLTVSRDGGVSWSAEVFMSDVAGWIATGTTGDVAYMVGAGDTLLETMDYGATWNAYTGVPAGAWPQSFGVASNGFYGAAAAGERGVYVSTPFSGWEYVNASGDGDRFFWNSACISGDGTRAYAVNQGDGYIYTRSF